MTTNMADEIEVIEVVVPGSSSLASRFKAKRSDSRRKDFTPDSNDTSNLMKAVQLKRRIKFTEKEKEELEKRFSELEKLLTDEEKNQLNQKVENDENASPPNSPSITDNDVVIVAPDDYTPKKKRRKLIKERSSLDGIVGDIAVTYSRAADNLPHAREHCRACKFVQSNVTSAVVSGNDSACEKCYCYVCDDLVEKCESWRTGDNPHCNGYAKNAFWENKRKEAKRKKKTESLDTILQCLTDEEKTDDINKAASASTEFLKFVENAVEAANDSEDEDDYDDYGDDCYCRCHGYGLFCDYDDACWRCEDNHYREERRTNATRMYESLDLAATRAAAKVREYLSEDKPSMALVVLDMVTSSILGVDLERYVDDESWRKSFIFSSLKVAWIKVVWCSEIPKTLLDKVKDRLSKSAKSGPFVSNGNEILESVNAVKRFDDPDVVRCLEGKCTASSRLQESSDIFQYRLSYLSEKKRYNEACNYILGAELKSKTSLYNPTPSVTRACDQTEHRKTLITYLSEAGRCMEAAMICPFPYNKNLPEDTTDKEAYFPAVSDKPPNANGPPQDPVWELPATCPLRDLRFEGFRRMVSGLVSEADASNNTTSQSVTSSPRAATRGRPSQGRSPHSTMGQGSQESLSRTTPSSDSTSNRKALRGKAPPTQNQKLAKALCLILSGAQVNNNLRAEVCMEFYIKLLCEKNVKNPWDSDSSNRKKLQDLVSGLVKRAKTKLLNTREVLVYGLIPFKACIAEFLIALLVELPRSPFYHSISSPTSKSLKAFHDRGLGWACVSIFACPAMKDSIKVPELKFFVDNLASKMDTSCLPQDLIEKWYARVDSVEMFDVLFKLTKIMLNEGKTKGLVELKKKAVTLSGKLCEGVLNNQRMYTPNVQQSYLQKVRKAFSTEAVKLGMQSIDNKILDLEFEKNPSVATLKAIQKTFKSSEQDKWLQKKSTLLEKLEKNARTHQAACIDIFGELKMFDTLKKVLTCPATNPFHCKKIDETLKRFHQPGPLQDASAAVGVVTASKDWLVSSLVDSCTLMRRSGRSLHMSNVDSNVTECLKTVHKVAPSVFHEILGTALGKMESLFLQIVVQPSLRCSLVNWLSQIKGIYCSVGEAKEWSARHYAFHAGPIKRKPAVAREVREAVALR